MTRCIDWKEFQLSSSSSLRPRSVSGKTVSACRGSGNSLDPIGIHSPLNTERGPRAAAPNHNQPRWLQLRWGPQPLSSRTILRHVAREGDYEGLGGSPHSAFPRLEKAHSGCGRILSSCRTRSPRPHRHRTSIPWSRRQQGTHFTSLRAGDQVRSWHHSSKEGNCHAYFLLLQLRNEMWDRLISDIIAALHCIAPTPSQHV